MAVLLTRASCLAGQCLRGSFRSRPERLQGKRKPSYTVSMATQGFGSVPSTSRRTCASATSLERSDSFLKRASLDGRLYAFSTRPESSRRGRQVACVPASPRANPRSRGGPSWGRPQPSRRNRWARDHRAPHPPRCRSPAAGRPGGSVAGRSNQRYFVEKGRVFARDLPFEAKHSEEFLKLFYSHRYPEFSFDEENVILAKKP